MPTISPGGRLYLGGDSSALADQLAGVGKFDIGATVHVDPGHNILWPATEAAYADANRWLGSKRRDPRALQDDGRGWQPFASSPVWREMEAGTFSPVHINWLDAVLRFAAAFLLSLALGLERFLHRKPIDFRPFVVISVASCALVLALSEFGHRTDQNAFSINPGNVMSGIMTGIGFIGAGALFRDQNVVHGTGSAASIWASGAIGIACGLGSVWIAAILVALLIVILVASRPFTNDYTIRIDDDVEEEDEEESGEKAQPRSPGGSR